MITVVTRDHLGDDVKWFSDENCDPESLSLFVCVAEAATSLKDVEAIVTSAGSSPEERENCTSTCQARYSNSYKSAIGLNTNLLYCFSPSLFCVA
jgi:hypothetical protein